MSNKYASKLFSEIFSSSCLHRQTMHPLEVNTKVGYIRDTWCHSFTYKLAVNEILASTIKMAMKYIKNRLELARSTTVAILHHPARLDLEN